jgi:hypothetical protein
MRNRTGPAAVGLFVRETERKALTMDYSLIALLVLALDIFAIVSIIRSGMDPVTKLLWVLIVLALPVIGMLLYFILNRPPGALAR